MTTEVWPLLFIIMIIYFVCMLLFMMFRHFTLSHFKRRQDIQNKKKQMTHIRDPWQDNGTRPRCEEPLVLERNPKMKMPSCSTRLRAEERSDGVLRSNETFLELHSKIVWSWRIHRNFRELNYTVRAAQSHFLCCCFLLLLLLLFSYILVSIHFSCLGECCFAVKLQKCSPVFTLASLLNLHFLGEL